MREASVQAFRFRNEYHKRIFEKLGACVGIGPASFFREACYLQVEGSFTTKAHLIAHLLREVESSLRDVAVPDDYMSPPVCDKCGNRLPGEHTNQIKAIATAYVLPGQITEAWIRLAPRLHGYAHRVSLDIPRTYADEFKTFCGNIDALFYAVLDAFETRSIDVYRFLDSLLQSSGKISENVDQLKRKTPHNLVTYQYFFTRLHSHEWLAPLKKRGFFAHPPRGSYDPESGRLTFAPWPQSRYLIEMAGVPRVQKLVFEIALQIAESENPYVRQDIVEIALRLPVDLAAQLASKIMLWMRGSHVPA